MIVEGKIIRKVDVNPIDVISNLINEFLRDGHDNYVKSNNGKYWLMNSTKEYHNQYVDTIVCEITEDDVKYINSLVYINDYLRKNDGVSND